MMCDVTLKIAEMKDKAWKRPKDMIDNGKSRLGTGKEGLGPRLLLMRPLSPFTSKPRPSVIHIKPSCTDSRFLEVVVFAHVGCL